MAVAVETGVPVESWIANPRALFTAAELLREQTEKLKRPRRRG